MGDLPEKWTKCQIGDVTKIVAGGTPPSKDSTNFSSDGGIPWITPSDLSGYKDIYIRRGARNLTEKGLHACSAIIMPAGSVLFSSRAPIGYVAIAANELTTNQGFKSFILPSELDSRFVYFYLRHIKPVAEMMATGTTFKELSASNIAKLPILIAPLNEQKRIADKLNTLLARVDSCQAHLERVPKILKRFRQAVLTNAVSGRMTEEWRKANPEKVDSSSLVQKLKFSHQAAGGHKKGAAAPPTEGVHNLSSEMFPKGWQIIDLRELVRPDSPITYGILKPGPDLVEGVPYIRVTDFPNNHLNLENIRKTSKSIDKEFSRSKLEEGDILLSIRGTVGRLIVIPPDLRGANITQDSARLSIQSFVNRDYVLWYLRSDIIQMRMKKSEKGVAVRGINIGDVRALQIAIPSIEEQSEIVRRVEYLFALADSLEAHYLGGKSRVAQITPSLLASAFRGKLVPQDPNDEPASVLLERIRGAREANKSMFSEESQKTEKSRISIEVRMLNRIEIKPNHLTAILKERGALTAEALWLASQLGIDDFYDQLKDEEANKILREVRSSDPVAPRLLEAI